MKINLQHSSMQYSDTLADHTHDALTVFTTLNHVITGTEAGGNALTYLLPQYGKNAGYDVRVSKPGEWIAVRKDFARILDVGWISSIPAVGGSAAKGAHQERGIFWVTIQTTAAYGLTGIITIGVSHFLTHLDEVDDNQSNDDLCADIGSWARKAGRGGPVFFGADTNTQDAKQDVFRGHADLKTCWDELDSHPSTGHGCIDVLAADKWSSCLSATVLTDNDLNLYSDHYTIQATYRVRT